MPNLPSEVACAMLECFREPIFVVGPRNELCYANKALTGFLGLEDAQAAVLALDTFWPQAPVLRQGECASEFALTNGARFAVKLSIHRLSPDYALVRVLSGISKNTTLHSFHAQRLDTLGMLAGGVAHDFNNVLTGILGHVTYLKTILPKSGDHVESLGAIEDGARKGTALTQQILGFSKLDGAEKVSEVNIGDLVRSICKLLRGAISPNYTLEFSVPDRPVRVLAVEGKLAQVLVNLIVNARDAVGEQGQIRVSAQSVTDKGELERAFGGADRASKEYVRLSVADNGHGMPKEIQAKIFEPYFSTKKDKGTGLGLAVVREIVELFGGAIVVDSVVGKGTTISVHLPMVSEDARDRAEQPGLLPLQRGSESVLVVDDEYPVRNVLLVSLQHLGYDVEVASGGTEAIQKYRARRGGFDLVLLDMIMPHQSGDEVFFELKKLDPLVKVLVISGFSSEAAVKSILANGGLDFLQKPFTIEDLAKHVRNCLGQGRRVHGS
ncbi:MAG: response regulator [Oligoflexia bacterium]|nr:response regulator [Oligoflexia bacterium]